MVDLDLFSPRFLGVLAFGIVARISFKRACGSYVGFQV